MMATRRLSAEKRAARELRDVAREERKLDAIRARLDARAKAAAAKLEKERKRKVEARRKAEAKEHAELQRLFSGIKRHEVKRKRKPKVAAKPKQKPKPKPKKRKAKKSGKLTGAAKAAFLQRMAKGRKKARK